MYTDVPRCDASTSSGKLGSTKLVTSAMSVMRPILGQGDFLLMVLLDLYSKSSGCNIGNRKKCPSKDMN
jgi:hypothetical protein